jgi:hypothetical protein
MSNPVLSADGKSVETTNIIKETKEALLMRKKMLQGMLDRSTVQMAEIDKKLALFPKE